VVVRFQTLLDPVDLVEHRAGSFVRGALVGVRHALRYVVGRDQVNGADFVVDTFQDRCRPRRHGTGSTIPGVGR